MNKRNWFIWWSSLLLVLLLSVPLASCAQSSPTPTSPPYSSQSVESWIKQHAFPLKTTEPGGTVDDLQPLKQIIGDASIVGVGEATHGTHEFFTMKQRIFEFLVTQMGFTVFAMENGWDASRQINNYILTGNGDMGTLVHHDLYGSWQAQEVVNLIEWMRGYNADPTHARKIQFFGIDPWNISQAAFDEVVQYIQTVDPAQAAQVQALYTGIRPAAPTPVFVEEGFSANSPTTKQRYQSNAQQVYTLLKTHESLYESLSSPQTFSLALEEAQVIVQYTTLGVLIPPSGSLFTSDAAYAKRDEFMADNVAWLHAYEGKQAKMMVWAHNVHIGSLKTQKNMGAFLREQFQESYRPIGTSFSQGSFTILTATSAPAFTAPLPGKDTYNYVLGSVGLPRYILDIRQAPSGPAHDWLQGPYGLLNYGVGGQDLEMFGSLQYWFDAVIFIQTSTPSHLLS